METQMFEKVQIKGYEIIGVAPMIDKPTIIGDWYCVPLGQYKSTIPAPGIQAIDRILKSDIEIKGFVVLEDVQEQKLKEKVEIKAPKTDYGKLIQDVLVVGAMVIGALAVGFVSLMLFALAYDPLLIAVTEDDQWLLLYDW